MFDKVPFSFRPFFRLAESLSTMLLLAFLLPCMVLASQPAGNQAGVVLGIFAMCGANPVDCGNGWCCLSGETCSIESKDTVCIDMQAVNGCRYVIGGPVPSNKQGLMVAVAKRFRSMRHTLVGFMSTRPHLEGIATSQRRQRLSNLMLPIYPLNPALTAYSFPWLESSLF